jgi:DNA ligase-1
MRTQPQDIIEQIANTSSKNDKIDILVNAMNENLDEFFEGLTLTYDKLITFGVKKVPEKKVLFGGQGLPWAVFKDLADKLRNRELTGHDARDAIELAMGVATQDQWNGFYRRILIKDMRAGFSESSINKAAKKAKRPEYAIQLFECQLAHDSTKHEKKLTGKKLIEVKLDGVRVLTIVRTDGIVTQCSRNGRPLENFGHIVDQISAVAKANPPPYDLVLDGEVMSSSFQDLMTQVHRKSNVSASDAVLHLFDFVPLEDFLKGKWNKTQTERSNMLQAWVSTHKAALPHVDVLSYEEIDLDTTAGQKRYVDLNRAAVDGGYEGIMIKDPDAPYECKRTASWLKLKPFIEVTLTVIAIEEGTGKNVGMMGALICAGNDDGKDIHVNVGGGYSDEQRQEFWDNKDEVISSLVEVRADGATQNKQGTWSLRFPRFRHFRDFGDQQKV